MAIPVAMAPPRIVRGTCLALLFISFAFAFDFPAGAQLKFPPLKPGSRFTWRSKSILKMRGDAVASEVHSASRNEPLRIYFSNNESEAGAALSQKQPTGSPAGGWIKLSLKDLVKSNLFCLRRAAVSTFLPAGYPSSVPEEYIRFQLWNILQDLTSNLRSILSTQKILEGMGVGRVGVTSLVATMQWIARDGASMIGGLVFTSLASSTFGNNVKKWRFFADLINDVALALDMLAPACREWFLPVICLSSVFKAMCGVSAGACNNAILQHWALRYPCRVCCICTRELCADFITPCWRPNEANIVSEGGVRGASGGMWQMLVPRTGRSIQW